MSIQRYDTEDDMYPMGGGSPINATWREGEGLWVLYSDHVQAVAAAEARSQGRSYRHGLDAAREAVAALDNCPECSADAALAAIDALRTDTAPRISTGYDPTATDNRP